jgi:hypothetical protein
MAITPKVELVDNQMIYVEPERVLTYMDDGTPITDSAEVAALFAALSAEDVDHDSLLGRVAQEIARQVGEPEFVAAVANGQLQTEAGTEALLEGHIWGASDEADNDMIDVLVKRIETLERAVLKHWLRATSEWDIARNGYCIHCDVRGHLYDGFRAEHAPDCIVPALLEKYPDV